MNWALISFFIYLLVICLIGVVTMRIGNTYEDFLIGGRRIGPWVSSFALITSYMSGYTYTAAPGLRSEERRVGKECRSRWSPYH